ncbi:DUF6230 family protein [Antrihabitans stalactiti]|uniref:Cholesterol esterase n=1 Tax=Antrihabitans stalactiti TaxID=2584121 RepID=A0A848KLG3_9NOCA|nr:DUF6230 family protein [Antrihabitans stalactiti]NMN96627.1 hypothetical protein [Antrihabitans stalactiti]
MSNPNRRTAYRIRQSFAKLAVHARAKSVAAVKSWNDAMEAEATDGTIRGTRWTRGVAVMLPAAVVSAVIGNAIVEGVLAAGVNFANQPITMHIDELNGNGLVAIMGSVNVKNDDGSIRQDATLHGAAKSADITGLCALIEQSVLGVNYTIVMKASGGAGNNMFFDMTAGELDDTVMSNAVIGKSADEIMFGGQSIGGQPGGFGLDASDSDVQAKNITGTAYGAAILGQMKIPHLVMNIQPGEATC